MIVKQMQILLKMRAIMRLQNPTQLVQIKTERIIRRKAQRLAVKDGEVYYKKKKGEVCRLS